MAYKIPFEVNASTEFTYSTVKITLGPIRWNPYLECWMTNYKDTTGKSLLNIPLRAGTNCVAGLNLAIPTLMIMNKFNIKLDPTINGDFVLFIIDEKDVEA